MHKDVLRSPPNAYAVVPVLLTAKGLKVSAGERIDTRYVDGCLLAMRKIQSWYQEQLGKTFNLDPHIEFVSSKTVAEHAVGFTEWMNFAMTAALIGEAHRAGVLDFCNPTRLFAIMTVGVTGAGGIQFGRNPGEYGAVTCPATPVLTVGFGTGISGGESAVIAGLDPVTEGLQPSSLTADQTTGGMAHEIGHCWGLEHPDHIIHGYLNGEGGSAETITATILTDSDGDAYGPPLTIADGGDGITAVQGTIGYASTGDPVTIGDVLVIDSERVLVTGVDTGSNLLTVTRAYQATTGATHAEGAAIRKGKNWPDNVWAGAGYGGYTDMEVECRDAATGATVPSQFRTVVSNTFNTITITPAFNPVPAAGSAYSVGRPRDLMGIGFYYFPHNSKLYQGEKDHLLNNHGPWFT